MSDTVVVGTGEEVQEIPLNEWIEDESTGRKTMYTRLQSIPICTTHAFDREHACGKCPYVFTGFRAHLHVQREDGIYSRKTGKKIA